MPFSALESILTGPIRIDGATDHYSCPVDIMAVGVCAFRVGQPDGNLGPVATVLDEAGHRCGPVCSPGSSSETNNDTIQDGTLST